MRLLCPSREIILAENNFALNYCGKKQQQQIKAKQQGLTLEFYLKICTQKFVRVKKLF